MNDIKKCSLSGIAFTMDADAYETLNEYMESLRESCGHTPDGDEIVADIEARIAELILSTRSDDSVVEKPLIQNIIRQMGRPEDISSESDGSHDGETAAGTDRQPDGDNPSDPSEPRIPRRMYRDMENAKLGGVCAGLARYFNADPVWVRLALVLPLLLSPVRFFGPMFGSLFFMVVLTYIVMWFAVPPARSARQKLEMNGERITAQSIRDTTIAGAADADSEAKPVVANVVTVFGQIILILLKILAGIIVFGLIIAACAMIIGMLVVLISGDSGFVHTDHSVLMATLGISVALVPVMLLIYVLMCLIASRKPGLKTVIAVFIVWVAVIMALIATALKEYGAHDLLPRHISQTRITSSSEVIVDGDTVQAVRSISDTADADDDADDIPESVNVEFRKDANKYSVTVTKNKQEE